MGCHKAGVCRRTFGVSLSVARGHVDTAAAAISGGRSMNRYAFVLMGRLMGLAGALAAASLSHAQVSCTREGLKAAADLYVAAQTKGDISGLPLAKGLGYVENTK